MKLRTKLYLYLYLDLVFTYLLAACFGMDLQAHRWWQAVASLLFSGLAFSLVMKDASKILLKLSKGKSI